MKLGTVVLVLVGLCGTAQAQFSQLPKPPGYDLQKAVLLIDCTTASAHSVLANEKYALAHEEWEDLRDNTLSVFPFTQWGQNSKQTYIEKVDAIKNMTTETGLLYSAAESIAAANEHFIMAGYYWMSGEECEGVAGWTASMAFFHLAAAAARCASDFYCAAMVDLSVALTLVDYCDALYFIAETGNVGWPE